MKYIRTAVYQYTGCGIKNNPRDLLAIFSAMLRNFNVKFYTLIYSSCTYMQVSTVFNFRILSWNYWHCRNAT